MYILGSVFKFISTSLPFLNFIAIFKDKQKELDCDWDFGKD